jgi:DNA-binding transcriptional LysR family regulator
MQNISWDEFRLVKAIAETGSLAGAGDVLALNHSTVFRRLNALEHELGSRLFERARTGYVPTPAGEEMVMLATRMFDDITDFERRVAGRDVKPSGDAAVRRVLQAISRDQAGCHDRQPRTEPLAARCGCRDPRHCGTA